MNSWFLEHSRNSNKNPSHRIPRPDKEGREELFAEQTEARRLPNGVIKTGAPEFRVISQQLMLLVSIHSNLPAFLPRIVSSDLAAARKIRAPRDPSREAPKPQRWRKVCYAGTRENVEFNLSS